MLTLVAAGLACALPGGPKLPASPIPVSTEAAGEMQNAVQTAVAEAVQSKTLELTLTEEQITSYVAVKLAEQTEAPFTDPQIFLRDGKIQIFGKAHAGQLTASAKIVLSASIDSEGQLSLTVDEADFGPVPVPETILQDVSAQLEKALTEQAGSNFVVTDITIAEGELTLTGAINP
jgi:uncharacterized protein YpmS